MAKAQSVRRQDCRRWARVALARKDVDDDVGGMDTLGERLNASRLDCRQSVGEHRGEDFDHLPVAVVGAGELARTRSSAAGNTQSLNGAPLRRAPGLRANGHIVPGIVDGLPGRSSGGVRPPCTLPGG